VLRLFAEGFLVTEIAKKLNRSIKTISSQKKSDDEAGRNDIALLNYLLRDAECNGQGLIVSG
jgi:two-component system capsular synthesis response regulator RcsB